jgi:hypothetical protein
MEEEKLKKMKLIREFENSESTNYEKYIKVRDYINW